MTDTFRGILKSAFITGLLSILPIGILLVFLVWLYGLISAIVAPVGALIPISSAFFVTIITLVVLVVLIVLLGVILRTRLGSYLFNIIEQSFFNLLPGYKTIKKTLSPFTNGSSNSSFRSVALVNLFENGTLATAFIIERHPHGRTTVFVPTGPNPTSGNIYHVKNEFVHPLDLSVEVVMKTVIAVGKSSHVLFENTLEPVSELDPKTRKGVSKRVTTKRVAKSLKKEASKKQQKVKGLRKNL